MQRRFLYDAWNLVTEADNSNGMVRQYMWGTDLSGSRQGAGGVGGLVKVYDSSTNKHFFPGYDGNGNVTVLVEGATGVVWANYEYGPFGELTRSTGPMATSNPFRFSTKYQDDESDYLYYGYRYYSASTGRWPNRDPLGERGGCNLYAFVSEDPVNSFDVDGRDRNHNAPPIVPVIMPPNYPPGLPQLSRSTQCANRAAAYYKRCMNDVTKTLCLWEIYERLDNALKTCEIGMFACDNPFAQGMAYGEGWVLRLMIVGEGAFYAGAHAGCAPQATGLYARCMAER